MDWQVIKEWCGFLGALAAAIPWGKDFFFRIGAEKRRKTPIEGGLNPFADRLKERDQEWLSKAKMVDLGLMIGGLSLVAASFLIGILCPR